MDQGRGISHQWIMYLATNSIPRETLHKILLKQIDPTKVEDRIRVARFYIQCERYEEARATLQGILADFPQQTDLPQRLAPTIQSLRDNGAKRVLSELKARRVGGQHQLVQDLLKKFPVEDTAGEVLQAVREMTREYEMLEARRIKVLKEFQDLTAKIEAPMRPALAPIQAELAAELSVDTLPRMASFLQNLGDPELQTDQKLALAISGWLLGSDSATVKFSGAMSAYRLRKLAAEYLNEPAKAKRLRLLQGLPTEEAASGRIVAALLAHMKPPAPLPESAVEGQPGYYKLEAPGMPKEKTITYHVQLPPQYNPLNRYPMIVTLHGSGTTAENQVDWWAGAWVRGARAGQAARQGYIVLAPEWTVEHQKQYGYSAKEHTAVLNSVRDACRRFAVDTDRVFLSGHSMGGDAAWDMGLAHPDLWAGVIPIVALSDRYCTHYTENAQRVPFYVVCGELDGGKMNKNARDLDRCMKHGYNFTVVEYLGRGHEHFSDEVLRLFDWMSRFRRDFYPRDFTCATMRPWDNFFWWVELDGLPSKAMVNPANWPPRGVVPAQVKAAIQTNTLNIRARAQSVTAWLSPQMVDFKQTVTIIVNGNAITLREAQLKPNLETMLEDVRTRGDRQHPFWLKVEAPTGRVGR